MNGKTCEECRGRFLPSRASQRFCSTRCANRQRDRRRRRHTSSGRRQLPYQIPFQDAAPDSSNATPARAPAVDHALDSVRSKLRTEATEIDRLEAENADQRTIIKSLRADVMRLHSVQQTDAKDLIHLAGRLLAISQTTGVELDNTTKQLFRRRSWTSAKNQEAQQQ